jgi:hypothetical protein
MDNRLVAPAQIALGLKLLLTDGAEVPVTVRVALAGLVLLIVVPPPVEFRAPTGIVLIKLPGVVEVTLTDTVQDPAVDPVWAGTVPPLRDMLVEPAAAVTEPPQVFPLTPTIVIPVGKLSVHDALVSAKGLGLKTVTRRRDVPPEAMEIGVKLLFISAGRDIPCADAVCSGVTSIETINTTIRRGTSVLRIFFILCMSNDRV